MKRKFRREDQSVKLELLISDISSTVLDKGILFVLGRVNDRVESYKSRILRKITD